MSSGRKVGACILGLGSPHPRRKQPGGTRTAPLGHRPQNQLRLSIRGRRFDPRNPHERVVTLKKRTPKPVATLTAALDALARDPDADVYKLLFGTNTS